MICLVYVDETLIFSPDDSDIDVVLWILTGVGLQKNQQFNILWSVFEDNAGALLLATTKEPRMTPKSKHYAVKYLVSSMS